MKKTPRPKKLKKIQTVKQLIKSRKFKLKTTLETRQKPIKYFADYQTEWAKVIPELPDRSIVEWRQVSFLSVMGDAPKDFITDREDRLIQHSQKPPLASYIAKVGSKFYPLESVVEQLITRIGQCYGLKIADSKLRIVAGQVRFMSKYFLNRQKEQLTHGAEILALTIGKSEYEQIQNKKIESEYFSFQMVCEAVANVFPDNADEITGGLIEMLTFDALIGHNDRHPYNWGVVVPLTKDRLPEFAPIFDTARSLFWNKDEEYCVKTLADKRPILEGYIKRCRPPFCWDEEEKVDFFRLIGLIWKGYERHRNRIEKLLAVAPLEDSIKLIDTEFSRLMSVERRELIKRCLRLRQKFLSEAVLSFSERREESNVEQN